MLIPYWKLATAGYLGTRLYEALRRVCRRFSTSYKGTPRCIFKQKTVLCWCGTAVELPWILPSICRRCCYRFCRHHFFPPPRQVTRFCPNSLPYSPFLLKSLPYSPYFVRSATTEILTLCGTPWPPKVARCTPNPYLTRPLFLYATYFIRSAMTQILTLCGIRWLPKVARCTPNPYLTRPLFLYAIYYIRSAITQILILCGTPSSFVRKSNIQKSDLRNRQLQCHEIKPQKLHLRAR